INDNNLIVGNVDLHEQLWKDHSKTAGGGYWHVVTEEKKVYLYSHSLRFKRAKISHVISALHGAHISPPSLRDHTFYYSSNDSLDDAMRNCVKVGKYAF